MTSVICDLIHSYRQLLLYPDGKLLSVDQLFAAVCDSMLVLNTDARLAAIVASWLFIFGTFNFLFPNMVKRLSWRKVRTTAFTIFRVLGPLVLFYYVWIPINRLLYWMLSQRKLFNLPISCQWLPFFSLFVGLAWFAASCNYLYDQRRRKPWFTCFANTLGNAGKRLCPEKLMGLISTPSPGSESEVEESLEIEEYPDVSPQKLSRRYKRRRREASREMVKERRRRDRYLKKLGIPREAFRRPPRSPRSSPKARQRDYVDDDDGGDRVFKSGRKIVYKRTTKTPPKTTRTGKVYGQ